jgi:23S rRNA (guanosine2251-2'-O)-methyltransferase
MTRKRDRRSSPPSFGSRNPPPTARGQTKGQGAEAKQALARSALRNRSSEQREAKVSLIYGFHSVGAALKAPRRELIRLYATAAAAERLSGEIAARGLETRIMAPE